MDKQKLEALQRSYAEAGVEGRRTPPYSGIPTFLGLPAAPSAAGLDVAVIGLPTDLGVTNRSGARLGPRAVRNVERIGPYHPTQRNVPQTTPGL